MYYNLISLFFIRNDGIYANTMLPEEIFDLGEDDDSLLKKIKRYLVKTYGRLELKNAYLKRDGNRIVIYRHKKRKEKELVNLEIKDNCVVISINDNRYNYKKSPKLHIINNKVYESNIISNYHSVNPFFDIYFYMIHHSVIPFYRDQNKDMEISDYLFIRLFIKAIEYLSIDAIVYGLERGLINENMSDEEIVLSTILSIIDSIRLLLIYKEHPLFVSILFCVIIFALTKMTLERQDKKVPISYYPFSKNLMYIEEYILNILLDLIASIMIKDIDILYELIIDGVRHELKDGMLLASSTLVKIIILTTVLISITGKDSKEYKVFNWAYKFVRSCIIQ